MDDHGLEVRNGQSYNYYTMKATAFLLILSFAANAHGVIINEVMYDPSGADSNREWIEIYNDSASAVDMTGWEFHDGSDHALVFIQGGSTLAAGGFAVIASSAAAFINEYSAPGSWLVIDSVMSLGNTSDTVAIKDGSAVVHSSLTYLNGTPWPSIAGQSLERKSLSGIDTDPANWQAGPEEGTPSAVNSTPTIPAEACFGGADEDGDGLIDCADTDCSADVRCQNRSSAKSLEVDDSKNPFSPSDPDAAFRQGKIDFNTPSDAIKSIRIANVRGETVRMLINNDSGPATSYSGVGSGTVYWDGRDDSGDVVPMGIYVVFLEAVGDNGKRITGRDTIVVGRKF